MLTMTVFTYPRSKLSVRHDVDIVKACILYADEVELVSPNATMLMAISAMPTLPEKERLNLILDYVMRMTKNPEERSKYHTAIAKYRELSRKFSKTPDERKMYEMFKHGFESAWKDSVANIDSLYDSRSLAELLPAFEKGIVKIPKGTIDAVSGDNFVGYVTQEIGEAISSGRTYPLFDERIGDFVQSLSKDGLVNISGTDTERLNHVAFVSEILDRLPHFGTVTIEDLLGIREELSKYLIRFRSAMVSYSKQIRNLAIDRDFRKDSESLIMSNITPAILEIEEQVKSNSYIGRLVKTATTEPLVVAPSSGLGVLVSALSALPILSSIGLGVAAGAAVSLAKSAHDWSARKQEIEKNQLYFYYKAGKLIAP